MASIGPIVAQVTPLDIFGGLLGAAQIQSARETWARLSTLDRFCVDRALARRNTTIEGLIQSGIGPDDGRLGSIFGECRRFTEPNLRRNVGCTTTDEHGWSVATTCNQSFATRDGNNQVHPVEPREAIELHFSGTRIVVAEVETGQARETRQARAEAQGRAEQLQVLKTNLAPYQRDASPVVRAEAARIQGRIEQQLAARTGPSAPDTETIDREVGGLGPLSQAEAVRLSALDRMSSLRAQAEARTRSDAPEGLKGGIPQDLQTFLSGFVADVTGIVPETSDERLKELTDAYARKRARIDAAARLARAVTGKSRFLLEGGRGDLIMLTNDSGKAPSVVRNLRGELVFEDGRAAACLYHAPLSDVFLNRQIRDRSAGLGAKLDLPLRPCGPNDLAKQDLIFAERERLLREPVDRVITLVEAVNGNLFARLAVVDAAALAAVRQADAAKANEVEALVRDRKGDGFGVVVVPNPSSVLCRVVPDKAEAHAAILTRLSDRIGDELPGRPVVAATSADGAFISVKRAECGAVYAGAADLAAITEAMTRDGLSHRFLPLWIAPSEVAQAQTEIDEGKTRSAEEQFKRQRELDDRRRLDREKEKDESARRETRERALRAQYGERARFFEQALGEEARGFATGTQPDAFLSRYQRLARHYQAQAEDRWEFMSSETTVLDYGTALYKDRPLETALATTRIRMRNRIKGEYQDVCYVTGYVNDAEFGVTRDPFGEPCDEVGPKLARYKLGERFSSRWIAP
ncbi:hypothetical protein [Methylobacterium sp. SyP6R]|uniref:hypothetical protein n=1 Tax=Methylobacterium sp. SyP6R TaxID=2718876 RepID=UPI001F4729B2|nr:hypothetical protein [Methylobacterium sp. SyP6R]MCF4128048.1 hypothetical protein [Methylobacterium sp. SyP6R]